MSYESSETKTSLQLYSICIVESWNVRSLSAQKYLWPHSKQEPLVVLGINDFPIMILLCKREAELLGNVMYRPVNEQGLKWPRTASRHLKLMSI